MCDCKNIKMGSYSNQKVVWANCYRNPVGIDRCIHIEIRYLWFLGIETIESCCGHNVSGGYIMVPDKTNAEKMISFGYERKLTEEYDPLHFNFKPKYYGSQYYGSLK